MIPVVLALACLSSCSTRGDPQATLDRAQRTFQHGYLERAQEEAQKGYRDFHRAGPEWAWRFRILEANVLYWRGMRDAVLSLLGSEPDPPSSGELAVQKQRLEGLSYASLHKFLEAERKLGAAEQLCAMSDYPACGDLVRARGRLEMERGNFVQAQGFYERTLDSARARSDRFLEAVALLNLSWAAEEQTHFDEALHWSDAALQISIAFDFNDVAQAASGNKAWAYYKLGEAEKAKPLFIEAKNLADKLGDVTDNVKWLTNAGYIYMDDRDFKVAEQSFLDSLRLAKQINSREDIIDSLIALAFVYEETAKLEGAKRYADEALGKAREDNNGRDQVYPLLVQGRVAARQHDTAAAEKAFREVAQSPDSPVFLKWEAERSLAHLHEDENQPAAADREYRIALSTFETARSELHHEDSRLPFLTNASRIYDDYIHFLVAQGKTAEALQVAEYSRARTLSEGLGLLKKGTSFAPEPLNAQDTARRAGGAILFYWLGEKQSYLWAITARTTRLFQLAPSSEIDAAVRSYRTKLEGPPEILEASNDGSTLYHMLVEPAHDLLSKEALAKNDRVFIIPDGSLNSLNFETLVVPEAVPNTKPHYWIEDVTITSAGSLRLLFASRPAAKQLTGKLLLIGDPVSPTSGPDNPYPELPNAAAEIHSIEQHFAAARQSVFTREQATPAAHLNGHPEQFSYIHFVAHGTASRTSPLDSAIILSRDPASKAATGEDDSFKLYARDIIQHKLHAELVTITACYGAGRRSYSGEGLVGLSWAFLRAGAHNVVGALWDVSSASSAQLMDAFYGELQKGKSPSAALRTAKLGLLHSDTAAFRKPFYWAPFQLYTGS